MDRLREEVEGLVVISLDRHGSTREQKVVRIMKEVWKGILVEKPIDGKGTLHEVNQLPTLKFLEGKILVKN